MATMSPETMSSDVSGAPLITMESVGLLKDDIVRLTEATVTPRNENGLEIFYDFAITPAIRVIPSYQHIWNPLTADVVKNERGADVFLIRLSLTW